jgi:hypothetical protein
MFGHQENRLIKSEIDTASTSASTVASDKTPSKDGLNPKICVGTHFPPTFVRTAEVPGQGMCHIYDDDSYCKTVIDGEEVNPVWGITRGGIPRKRLAIACLACRKMKMKCHPGYPQCARCKKLNVSCKLETV